MKIGRKERKEWRSKMERIKKGGGRERKRLRGRKREGRMDGYRE